MTTVFADFFDHPQPSTIKSDKGSRAKMSFERMLTLASPEIVRRCITCQTGVVSFTTREIFDAVPEINQAYETSKVLGDRLGRGVAGHGLGLHPAPHGGHLICRENALLAVWGACCHDFLSIRRRLLEGTPADEVMTAAELDREAVEDLMMALGFEAEALSDAIRRLPSCVELN